MAGVECLARLLSASGLVSLAWTEVISWDRTRLPFGCLICRDDRGLARLPELVNEAGQGYRGG